MPLNPAHWMFIGEKLRKTVYETDQCLSVDGQKSDRYQIFGADVDTDVTMLKNSNIYTSADTLTFCGDDNSNVVIRHLW